MLESDAPQKSEVESMRDNVCLPDIPFTWTTNLNDEDIRGLYQTLLRERFFVHPPGFEGPKHFKVRNRNLFGIAIHTNSRLLEFQERICMVLQLGDRLFVMSRTPREWEEIETAKADKERQRRKQQERKEMITREYETHLMQGKHLLEQGKYWKADRELRKAVDTAISNPDCLSVLFCSAEMTLLDHYQKTENVTAGLAFLHEVQKRLPQEFFAWRRRWVDFGYDFESRGSMSAAEKIYQDAIMNSPDDGAPYKRLALIYERSERYDDAIAICELAIQRNLSDGTKSGFEGRIRRIRKKRGRTL
jgi:tetratricopeptide (TPR) repeat protein